LKILALDIGNHSIKALYFEKKYRGYGITSFSNTLIKRDSKNVSMDQISATIASLIKDNNYEPDKTIVLYPSDKTTHRFITLPFRDAKRISATLPSELEEQFPFGLDDIIYDWQIIESKGRNSRILVTATKKQDYDGFISMLKDINVFSNLVVPGIDPLIHLMNYLKLGEEYVDVEKDGVMTKELKPLPVALVDVGCYKTTVVIVKDGLPEHIRIINYGGDYVTRKIMERYDLGYEEAERSKIEVGYIIMEGDTSSFTEEQIGFSNVIKEAVDVIIRDVNQAIAEYKAEKKEGVHKCFLAGSGWKTRNFIEYMIQELRVPVEQLSYSKALGVKLPFADTPEEPVFSSLVGFFLRFANKSSLKGFNIATGIEQDAGLVTSVDYFDMFKPTVKNVVIGLVLFFVYAMSHSFLLGRVQAKYRTELEGKFKIAFPDKDRKAQAALLGNMSKLSREIDSRMKVQKAIIEGVDTGPKGISALAILKDFSSAIPSNQTVDVLDLSIDGKSIKAHKVIAAGGEVAQLFRDDLEKSGKFEAIKQGEIKQITGGGREFEITATYKGGK